MAYTIRIIYTDEVISEISVDAIKVQLTARPSLNPDNIQSFEVGVKSILEPGSLDLESFYRPDVPVNRIEYLKDGALMKTYTNLGPGIYMLLSENQGGTIGTQPMEFLKFYRL